MVGTLISHLVMKYTGISLSEAKNKTMRERDGRDIYKSFSNEIYRHVSIRGKEKTKGRCHHHHNEQYGTNST